MWLVVAQLLTDHFPLTSMTNQRHVSQRILRNGCIVLPLLVHGKARLPAAAVPDQIPLRGASLWLLRSL